MSPDRCIKCGNLIPVWGNGVCPRCGPIKGNIKEDKKHPQATPKAKYVKNSVVWNNPKMNLDKSQKAFCETNANYVRLLAPAGSGKTLSLLWRCRWLFEQRQGKPCRFLIFTFTRVARDELRDRLLNDLNFSAIRNFVRIETLNQWGYNYLKKNIQSSLTIKDSKTDAYFLVKNLLRPIWTQHPKIADVLEKKQWKYTEVINVFNALKSSGFRHNSHNFQNDFISHVEWLEKNGLGRYFEVVVKERLIELELFASNEQDFFGKFRSFLDFWKQACDHLWSSAVISLDDQKYWAWLKLKERYGNSAFPEPNRYQHIMVDEFQDINPLDLFLIKTLVDVNKSSLTIVGDDDQAVYEWRGSTPQFILKPDIHFGTKFETYELTSNYRSPKNIVNHSQKLIANNENRVKKNVNSQSDLLDAEIIVKNFSSHMDSLDFVLDVARKADQTNKPKQLAIIGRKKSQIVPIQIILTSEDIPYYAKEDLNVLLSRAFEDVKEILFAVAEKQNRRNSKDVIASFLRCCDYVGSYPLKKEEQRQLQSYLIGKQPKTFVEALKYFRNYDGVIKGTPERKKKDEYFFAIENVIESETVCEAIQEIGQQFKGLQKHYVKAEDDIFYKEPPFLYLAEYAKRYNSDFWGFIDHVEKAIGVMGGGYTYNDTDSIDDFNSVYPPDLTSRWK